MDVSAHDVTQVLGSVTALDGAGLRVVDGEVLGAGGLLELHGQLWSAIRHKASAADRELERA